ncbi:2346_t:CDS:2, partial [Entrophospora sp. SA101]
KVSPQPVQDFLILGFWAGLAMTMFRIVSASNDLLAQIMLSSTNPRRIKAPSKVEEKGELSFNANLTWLIYFPEKEEYDGENDYGGALFVLKKLLDEWENPPKPALTPEQEEKLKNYDELKKENEKLRNRELTDNEKKIMSEFRRTFPNTGTINARLRTVRRMLNNLERNDLSVEANPNLSAEKISFSQRLAESFEQFTLVCELYLGTERDFSKKLKELRDEIHRLEDKIDELEGERQ